MDKKKVLKLTTELAEYLQANTTEPLDCAVPALGLLGASKHMRAALDEVQGFVAALPAGDHAMRHFMVNLATGLGLIRAANALIAGAVIEIKEARGDDWKPLVGLLYQHYRKVDVMIQHIARTIDEGEASDPIM